MNLTFEQEEILDLVVKVSNEIEPDLKITKAQALEDLVSNQDEKILDFFVAFARELRHQKDPETPDEFEERLDYLHKETHRISVLRLLKKETEQSVRYT